MKKHTIFIALLILVFTSDIIAQKSLSAAKLNKELKEVENLDALLDFEIDEVNRLFERSTFFRVKMVEFAAQLKAEEDKTLGAQNLVFSKSNTNTFMALRDSLYAYTYKYENAMKISQSSLKRKNITELQRTKAVMLSTACALILYDNYLTGVVLLEQDTRARRAANEADAGFGVNPNPVSYTHLTLPTKA